MKNIILILSILFTLSCKSQTYPLRTYTDVPDNSYLKDMNNELNDYVGTWKATWNNKTIYIYIFEEINKYNNSLNIYKDYLIIKFKVTDALGNILFNNTNLSNNDAKIFGSNFKGGTDTYSLGYGDDDLCGKWGLIRINFTDSTKTQLNWVYSEQENWLEPDCFYYNYPLDQRPEPLPQSAVFTKQ
ncbi:hypothetical protein J3D55_000460 [Chryseobacterium ginsenosidimutans]|jgi:hypothetical protein|uniref:DUF6705 family protein n=1 Tax=Chryseobacterium ginsenosidimutans TaxID=687846 RepID=UPI002168F3D0|nr:DUF6705 family protein [Chryseobacterium ginsenosidimutans]MCS3867544.1 hypothetical protein [Chryseobacterium ginsenosidimutans]